MRAAFVARIRGAARAGRAGAGGGVCGSTGSTTGGWLGRSGDSDEDGALPAKLDSAANVDDDANRERA